MTTYHTVMPGQNLSSIARQYKLKSWKDIYKYDANEAFRGKRPNENLIFPGDIVVIPDGSPGPKAASVPAQPPLSCDSKAAAVAILKTSPFLDANTKATLTPGLVTGILAAEAKRISWWEGGSLDGDTKGPGQIGQLAYTDVITNLKPALNQFLVHMGTTCGASLIGRCGISKKPLVLQGFPQDVVIDPVKVDFFVAAYLALRIMEAKGKIAGRSADDRLQFGIGLYHGAHDKIFAAQKAISPADEGKSVLAYQPVKAYLLKSSDAKYRDVAAYIEEVYDCR